MTAGRLQERLDTPQSQQVAPEVRGRTSVGHASVRRTVEPLRTERADLTDDDVAHTAEGVGYVHRHLAQRPAEGDPGTSRWRAGLVNGATTRSRAGRPGPRDRHREQSRL